MMNKAVILDRDGVINEDVGYLYMPNQFKFKEGIFQFCLAAQNAGYLLIVATNQSGIARGFYTENDYMALTRWMCQQFAERSVQISRVYWCPFHPEKGIGKYKANSQLRKPNPGMILKAREEFDLDLQSSILIGDRDSDMEAGRRAGIGTLLLLSEKNEGEAGENVHILHSLRECEAFL